MFKKPVIVFEGIEGSGKSYHINTVSKFLKQKKISFLKIREPGGNKNSEKIRNFLLNNKSTFNKKTDLLMYLAARSENIIKLKSNYKKRIILIDRFTDSTIAYQHYGFKIDINMINILNNLIVDDFKVDFTFFHIVNEKNMLSRLKKRKKLNRYDKFNKNFYKRVQKGFLKLYKKKKNKSLIINSNLSIDENRIRIIEKVQKLIK